MYTVHPRDIERYCLRLLLLNVKGATSYEDLRSYRGSRGLLENDDERDQCIVETSNNDTSGSRLRHLFVINLLCCEVSDPGALWLRHREALSEDKIYKLKNNGMHNHVNLHYAFYLCLKEIDTVLQDNNSSLMEVSKIDLKAYNLLSGRIFFFHSTKTGH
jgi:hypothetical protein